MCPDVYHNYFFWEAAAYQHVSVILGVLICNVNIVNMGKTLNDEQNQFENISDSFLWAYHYSTLVRYPNGRGDGADKTSV